MGAPSEIHVQLVSVEFKEMTWAIGLWGSRVIAVSVQTWQENCLASSMAFVLQIKGCGYHLVFCETDSIAVQQMITQESQSRINMLLIPSIWAFSTMIGSYPLSTICMKGTCVHIGWQNHQHNLPRAFLFDYELLSAQASFVISWCYGFCFSEAVAILLFCSLSFIHIKNNIKNY